MRYLKKFNENSEIDLEEHIVLVFADLEDNGFKVKYIQDDQEIVILKWKREPFEWKDISDKLHLYTEYIQNEYNNVRLSYLTEAYYIDDNNKKVGFWFPHDPFDEVWNIYVNDNDIEVNRDNIKIVSIGIFTEF